MSKKLVLQGPQADQATLVQIAQLARPAFRALTASFSMSEYSWNPTSSISPDWFSPSTSPAPRISRSCIAR